MTGSMLIIVLGDGNWQMDIIANDLISPSSSGFINEDGTKTTFQDQAADTFLTVGEYPTWTWNDVSIDGITSLSTADLDGNGLEDIVVTGNDRIHAYYSLGDGNWQMDIIANDLG